MTVFEAPRRHSDDQAARAPIVSAPPRISGVLRVPAVPGSGAGHDFSGITVHSGGAPAEHVAVSAPGDPAEREADAVAAAVTRAEFPGTSHSPPPTAGPWRAAAPGKGVPGGEAHEGRAEWSTGGRPPALGAHGGGRPLTRPELTYFEPRFGCDLSRVRIRDDAAADAAARSVGATAYTLGSEIVVRSGAYRAGTASGRQLLAHEITHVLQQNASPRPVIQRQAAAAPAPPVPRDQSEEEVEAGELANAGLLALATVLQGGLADEAELLRGIYNEGTRRIAQEEARLMAEVAAGRTTSSTVA